MLHSRLLAILLLLSLLPGSTASGQPAPQAAANGVPDKELIVATKEAAPFAMKGEDGAWHGVSIDLWRRIAEQLHLRYRFVEVQTIQELLETTASGSADAAVAAITVTADRAQRSDFTQPFYETGLGVAVQGGLSSWLPLLRSFLSVNFLQAVFALLAIALFVGVLIWLFERRDNRHFAGPAARGLTSGIWWSAVAMTQAGAAHEGPASLPGRILAVIWMVASIITVAMFTAGITSAITTHQLQGLVRSVDDLRSLRVGVVDASSSADFLDGQRISHRSFASPSTGLLAVQAGLIDAFVYDRPLLSWMVKQDYPRLQVLRVTFDLQNYAIALPPNSLLRTPVDIALLQSIKTEWWDQVLYRYLGTSGTSTGG